MLSTTQPFVALSVPMSNVPTPIPSGAMKVVAGTGIAVSLMAVVWALLGLVAFVWSLVCAGRMGSVTDKSLGILIAVIAGPLFFLYLKFNRGYCSKTPQV